MNFLSPGRRFTLNTVSAVIALLVLVGCETINPTARPAGAPPAAILGTGAAKDQAHSALNTMRGNELDDAKRTEDRKKQR